MQLLGSPLKAIESPHLIPLPLTPAQCNYLARSPCQRYRLLPSPLQALPPTWFHILSFLPFLALLLGKVVHASNGAPLIGAASPPPHWSHPAPIPENKEALSVRLFAGRAVLALQLSKF